LRVGYGVELREGGVLHVSPGAGAAGVEVVVELGAPVGVQAVDEQGVGDVEDDA
jgi:hypothetical protein